MYSRYCLFFTSSIKHCTLDVSVVWTLPKLLKLRLFYLICLLWTNLKSIAFLPNIDIFLINSYFKYEIKFFQEPMVSWFHWWWRGKNYYFHVIFGIYITIQIFIKWNTCCDWFCFRSLWDLFCHEQNASSALQGVCNAL